MMNPDLSSTHEGAPITTSVAPWIKPGAATVQALPMAMPVHAASGAAHPLVQAIHHLLGGGMHPSVPPVQGRYAAPTGGQTATAPGSPPRTVTPPSVTQPQQTDGPHQDPRPSFSGQVRYYP